MIPKVIFKFNKEKDLWNIWNSCNAKSQYGKSWKGSVTSNILKICRGKSLAQCKKELVKTMSYIHKNKITTITAQFFNDAWKKIDKEYFRRLEKIMGSPFPCKKVTAYLTTAGRFPYNPNKNNPSFYVGFFGSIAGILHTAGHELMHIHFHNSEYWKICEKEIGEKKTMDLKEALTVLLNWEFHDLWIIQDNGYPNHVELRKFISLQWEKEKDFDKLIDKCVKWIKENGIK